MDTLAPGHYWKTPFLWEPGCPEPPKDSRLRFEVAPIDWLRSAIAAVIASSLDESDMSTVGQRGLERAVAEVSAFSAAHFEARDDWWQVAVEKSGRRVGFVLTSVFADRKRWKDAMPQATILYMGVLPEFRGRGYAQDLLHQAIRLCRSANCWRLFCDAGSGNQPMIKAFRAAGFQERVQWQRPLL